jgi:hypothetical protein
MSFNRKNTFHVLVLGAVCMFFVWAEFQFIIMHAVHNLGGRQMMGTIAFGTLLIVGTSGGALIFLAEPTPHNKFIAKSGTLTYAGMMVTIAGMVLGAELRKYDPMVASMEYPLMALVLFIEFLIAKRVWTVWSSHMKSTGFGRTAA